MLERADVNDPTLITIQLNWKAISDEGAIQISKALGRNTTVQVIMLANNQIGDLGAAALANSLQANPERAVTSLNLGCNCIVDKGADRLADLVKNGHVLKNL